MNSEIILIINLIIKYVFALISLFIISNIITNITFRKIVFNKTKKTRPVRV